MSASEFSDRHDLTMSDSQGRKSDSGEGSWRDFSGFQRHGTASRGPRAHNPSRIQGPSSWFRGQESSFSAKSSSAVHGQDSSVPASGLCTTASPGFIARSRAIRPVLFIFLQSTGSAHKFLLRKISGRSRRILLNEARKIYEKNIDRPSVVRHGNSAR